MSTVERREDGTWIDVSGFRTAGDYFLKHNENYCLEPWGSPAWYEFWKEERNRCRNGITVDGHKIPGDYYFYLNYCPIQKVDIANATGRIAQKIEGFPDFWEGDYEYFWCREIARHGVLKATGVDEEEQKRVAGLPEEERYPILMQHFKKLGIKIQPLMDQLDGGRDMIIGKSRRKGFEQPHSEIIMTPNGETTMGELKIGDEVLTPTGKAKVLEKFPQGKKDVYEVTLKDGRKVTCGLNHLWKVFNTKGNLVTVTTEYLLKYGFKTSRRDGKDGYRFHVPQTNPVEFNSKDSLPIHPYLLGLLLGDGSFTQSTLLFSTEDFELLNYIKDILGEDYGINKRNGTCQYSITYNKEKQINPIQNALKTLGLRRSSAKHKFIPPIYKYASIENRWELIKGLMDTDGSAWRNGSCNFVNTSENLIDDLAYVLRSLGVRVHKSKANYTKIGTPFWCLVITTDKEVFKLDRKNQYIKKRCYNIGKVAITDIKKLNYQEESSCILIDSKEHLYLTKDFIVTHNSYKNASAAVCNYFHRPKSYTMLIAYEKKYLFPGKKTIFGKCKEYINFVNKHTAWKLPAEYINTQSHIKASHKESRDGVDIEVGFLSEIEAISFKDNPDAGRGADAYDIIGEEVGAWGTVGGLKNTLAAMRSSSEAGNFKTGMITLFGTSGDMQNGTVDFADLFRRPQANGFMAFYDRWGKFKDKVEGFFFAKQMNMEGFYDKNGNSDMEGAMQAELSTRKHLIENGATSTEIQKRMQEEPLNSAEAFAMIATNTFPVVELQAQLDKVVAMNLQTLKGTPVKLHYVDGVITASPILDGSAKPITSFKDIPLDIQGCPMIYEHPVPDAPPGLYKIGYDPIRQESGTSLAAIIVYKGTMFGSYSHDIPVAEYIGRYEDPDDIDRVAEMFADLYNTKIMYENEVTGVKNYFRRIKRLSLLALQPDTVISKNIKASKVARVYGCHMNEQLKDAGERYVKSWLLSVLDHDENGNPIRVIDKIYSIRLLEELISYYRKGNFDLVSALFMCMFQVQEEVLGKAYTEEEETPRSRKYRQLLELMENQYK